MQQSQPQWDAMVTAHNIAAPVARDHALVDVLVIVSTHVQVRALTHVLEVVLHIAIIHVVVAAK